MRISICFAVAFAVFATVSARADDQSAKWVGRWRVSTEYTATPQTLTLKETGGKMTGDIGSRALGIAIFKGDALRLKFEDVFGGRYDCTVSLRTGGAEFGGDCFYFQHGRDEKRHLTGVRRK
jgi:hypothetical protein